MYHSFDVDIAADYGIPEAIFLCNIYFWVKQNTLNKHNYFEGRYWTYNSLSAYTGLFPYMSKSTIQRAIKHLKDEGLILAANFNNDRFNHTNYYTLTEKGLSVVSNPIHRCSQNDHIDSADLNTSIFNKNTDSTDINNTDINLQIPPLSPRENLFEMFWTAYPKCKRKVDKDGCKKKFIKIENLEEIFPDIMNSLEVWKRDWSKDNYEYVPMPSKWINQKYWTVTDMRTEKQIVADEAAMDLINKLHGGNQ